MENIRRDNFHFAGPRGYHRVIEKMDEIDARIPAEIRARVEPMYREFREHMQEFRRFREGTTKDVSTLQEKVRKLEAQLNAQQVNSAELNMLFRAFFMPGPDQQGQNEQKYTNEPPRAAAPPPRESNSRARRNPREPTTILCTECGKTYQRPKAFHNHRVNGVCQKTAGRNIRRAARHGRVLKACISGRKFL